MDKVFSMAQVGDKNLRASNYAGIDSNTPITLYERGDRATDDKVYIPNEILKFRDISDLIRIEIWVNKFSPALGDNDSIPFNVRCDISDEVGQVIFTWSVKNKFESLKLDYFCDIFLEPSKVSISDLYEKLDKRGESLAKSMDLRDFILKNMTPNKGAEDKLKRHWFLQDGTYGHLNILQNPDKDVSQHRDYKVIPSMQMYKGRYFNISKMYKDKEMTQEVWVVEGDLAFTFSGKGHAVENVRIEDIKKNFNTFDEAQTFVLLKIPEIIDILRQALIQETDKIEIDTFNHRIKEFEQEARRIKKIALADFIDSSVIIRQRFLKSHDNDLELYKKIRDNYYSGFSEVYTSDWKINKWVLDILADNLVWGFFNWKREDESHLEGKNEFSMLKTAKEEFLNYARGLMSKLKALKLDDDGYHIMVLVKKTIKDFNKQWQSETGLINSDGLLNYTKEMYTQKVRR